MNNLHRKMLLDADRPNQAWELHYSSELLWNGLTAGFTVLVDKYSAAVLAMEERNASQDPETHLLNMLDRAAGRQGFPERLILSHSGFISLHLGRWCMAHSVKQVYLYSGNLSYNSYIERFAKRQKNPLDVFYGFHKTVSAEINRTKSMGFST